MATYVSIYWIYHCEYYIVVYISSHCYYYYYYMYACIYIRNYNTKKVIFMLIYRSGITKRTVIFVILMYVTSQCAVLVLSLEKIGL